MITIEEVQGKTIRYKVSEMLGEHDFELLSKEVDNVLKKHNGVRLLADGSDFTGWDGFHAMQRHFDFIQEYQARVERIAFIAVQFWQHWMVGAASLFFHPQIRVFPAGHQRDAEEWLKT
jgi:hypothetical protein